MQLLQIWVCLFYFFLIRFFILVIILQPLNTLSNMTHETTLREMKSPTNRLYIKQ